MNVARVESALPTLLQLRLLVGYLGEKAQFGWWQTAFFGEYSLRSLEFIAPTAPRLAQYHGVVEAARRVHDEHLNVGCYHLFRLPEEVEQDLHALMQSEVGADLARRASADRATAMAALRVLAAGETPAGEGPAAIGRIGQLAAADTLKAFAGSYYFAFSGNSRTYPYLLA